MISSDRPSESTSISTTYQKEQRLKRAVVKENSSEREQRGPSRLDTEVLFRVGIHGDRKSHEIFNNPMQWHSVTSSQKERTSGSLTRYKNRIKVSKLSTYHIHK